MRVLDEQHAQLLLACIHTPCVCMATGEKQQKGKGLSIPFLHQLPVPSAGGEKPRMPVGMKLEPGVPLPTWICDTVSARRFPCDAMT